MKPLIHILLALVFASSAAVRGQERVFTFQVQHDHFIGKGPGQLTISREGVAFAEEKKPEHSRQWTPADIQHVKIESSRRIGLLSYEDSGWKLNRDRGFEFDLLDGEVSPEVVNLLREILPVPVASAVFTAPDDVLHKIPAKHRHASGAGCEGELAIGRESIYFHAPKSKHSRLWAMSEVQSLGRMSPYDLRITVREHSHAGSSRNFQFQLKRPLADRDYDRLWRQIYEPGSWLATR